MRMRSKAFPGLNTIVVDHAQGPKAHVLRVVVVTKGESVVRVEPAD
jgi:hypothetical protein